MPEQSKSVFREPGRGVVQAKSVIWMGLGIFDRLYSDKKIKLYFDALDLLPNQKVFILADEVTGVNNFVLNSRKHDRMGDRAVLERHIAKAHERFLPKNDLISTLIRHSRNPEKWRLEYWHFLSGDSAYQRTLAGLSTYMNHYENYYLKREMLRITIFGFGARLRKNFTKSFVDLIFEKDFYRCLETLANYALEEVAATLYLAQKGWVKAGHEEEKAYDELSTLCYERLGKELSLTEKPSYYYFSSN